MRDPNVRCISKAIVSLSVVGTLWASASAEVRSLTGPPFAAGKAAAIHAAGDAFPAGDAGMAAYVKVEQPIAVESVVPLFSRADSVGDNFIYGVVPISNFGDAPTDVHLYVDSEGWLVAYLTRAEPTALMMQWLPADVDDPAITTVLRNTLTDALGLAGDAAGVGVRSREQYYDFKYPDATMFSLIVKTTPGQEGGLVQVEVPSTYSLFEASYHHYTYDADDSQMKVDGTLASDAPNVGANRWWVGSGYLGSVDVGKIHTLEVSYDYDGSGDAGSAGVAIALVYSPGE